MAPDIGMGFDCCLFNLYGVNITRSIADVLSAPFKGPPGLENPGLLAVMTSSYFPFSTLAQRSLAHSAVIGTL